MFDGVRVVEAADDKVSRYHTCTGVETGIALGDTFPVPPCFEDRTDTWGWEQLNLCNKLSDYKLFQ